VGFATTVENLVAFTVKVENKRMPELNYVITEGSSIREKLIKLNG